MSRAALLSCAVLAAALGSTRCSSEESDASASVDAGPRTPGDSLFTVTALLPDGGTLGTVQPDGTVVDAAGTIVGTVAGDGSVVDDQGNVIGTTTGVGVGSIEIGDCAAEIFAGENVPVDIYVMFDQSGSMVTEDAPGTQRIDAVRAAVSEFLDDPASLGLGVGIGYFGKQPIGEVSCDPADYATPDVGIDRLPGNTPSIVASLSAVVPTGETPTGAAIRGACEYAQSWKSAHPTNTTIILLVTDGVPEAPVSSSQGGCDPTLADAVGAASSCAEGAPGIATYVIGVGPSLGNLDQIANAGGTKDAYLVEGGDVAGDVLAALNEIRGSATIPCEFAIPKAPSGESIDYGQVNAVYTDPDGQTAQLFYVESVDGCDAATGGWYYDDAGAPTRMLLCESTCTDVERPGGLFSVALGCETVSLIR